MLKGVLFDMDGLMVDTEKLYTRFWIQAAGEYGFDMKPEHTFYIRSLAAEFAASYLQGIFGEDFDYFKVRDRRRRIMYDYIEQNGIEKKKGLDELLEFIRVKGLKCAVCTASNLRRTERFLKSIDVCDNFEAFVCAEMIAHGKPMPDIYLAGAKALGLDPGECLALEDSQNGITSAHAAGCITVMVPDMTPPGEYEKSKVYAVCSDLSRVIDVIDELTKQF